MSTDPGLAWSESESGQLVRAVDHAPSVHGTQPWMIGIETDAVDLYARDVRLPEHDPGGRDRSISCGAALANLELAMHVTGRTTDTDLFPGGGRGGRIARVSVIGQGRPTLYDLRQHAALFRRESHRRPFRLHRIPEPALHALTALPGTSGTQVRVVDRRTECAPLAGLLAHAARILRDDEAYQRELTAWIPLPPGEPSALPWAGLVRADTHLLDPVTLTERLMQEGLLVVMTPDDSPRDHVLAGVALERTWLAAITRGLVGSVLTQPFHLAEVRAGLIEDLELAGFPQAILRVGYPEDGRNL